MTLVADQAQALRKLVKHTEVRRAHIVAITSGKGGVGKSNIAVNLAIHLSQMGRRVILLDADLGTANVDVLCNLSPAGSLAHVVAGRRTLEQTIIPGPGGFSLIPGASGLAQMAALGEFERARLIHQIKGLERDFDLILIDTGAGVTPNVLGFAMGADLLLVVTTPEPTALMDAYAVIKTLKKRRNDLDLRILVNMVRDAEEAREVFNRMAAVCRRFLGMNPRYAGHMVIDACVAAAVRRRRPFVLESPQCAASMCIGRLAHRLDHHVDPPQGEGLLRKMASWLPG